MLNLKNQISIQSYLNREMGVETKIPNSKSCTHKMFSVPGKRTNRSLARTKHARSKFFLLVKKKKKKISVGT